MGHKSSSGRSARIEEIRRRVSALRAFHTGLVAETHHHLHTLGRMTPHIDTLRHPTRHASEKLAAAEASCKELTALERLRRPWRDTYTDFRQNLHRLRTLLRRIVGSKRRRTPG